MRRPSIIVAVALLAACDTASVQMQSIDDGVDLAVVMIEAPELTGPGLTPTIRVEYENRGTGVAGASLVHRLVLARSSTASAGDVLLATWSGPTLAPGQGTEHVVAVALPDTLDLGERWLIVQLDAEGVADDVNPANNSRAEPVELVRRPDLVVADFDIVVTRGEDGRTAMHHSVRIENIGNAEAPERVPVFWYLSTDSILDPAAARGVGGTRAAVSQQYAATSYAAAGHPPAGTYYGFVFIDPDGELEEIDRSNNQAFVMVDVPE